MILSVLLWKNIVKNSRCSERKLSFDIAREHIHEAPVRTGPNVGDSVVVGLMRATDLLKRTACTVPRLRTSGVCWDILPLGGMRLRMR